MRNLAERLHWAMQCAGMPPESSQSELARLVGPKCTPQTIQNILSGGQASSKYTPRLAQVLGCDALWLSDGSGNAPTMHNSPIRNTAISDASRNFLAGLKQVAGATLDEEELPHPTEDEFAFVPQLDIAAACGNGRFEDHVVVKGGLAFKKSFLRDKGVPEHAARIIYASGGSMSPTLQDGCVVLLNLAETEPRDGKVYAICKPDDGLVLKRLIWDFHPAVGRQTWIMRSDNPDKISHPDKLLPPDDRTMIAGRAVWNDNQL